MRPIPESEEAERQYGPLLHEGEDLLIRLSRLGRAAHTAAPACVALSLSTVEHGATFTVVSGDPCRTFRQALAPRQDCSDAAAVVSFRDHVPAEQRSHDRFVRPPIVVRTTLSLTVLQDAMATARFDLYGTRRDTFHGRGRQLAQLLGVAGAGATFDADLALNAVRAARRAPYALQDLTRFTVAAALLAQARHVPISQAEVALRDAAIQSAVCLTDLVDTTIDVLR